MPDVSIGATAHQTASLALSTTLVRAPARASLASEIRAGATTAILTLPFSVTAGVLAFGPLGPDYVAAGAATGLLCAVAGGLVGALARSSSFIATVPSVPLALIQASFIAALLQSSGGDVAVVLALAPLSIFLAGIWQAVSAWFGFVRIIKFTPYPVLAGFVTGLAVRTFVQQFPRLFDLPNLGAFLSAVGEGTLPHLEMAGFGLVLVVLMRASDMIAPRVPAMLVGLVVGTIAWHGLAAIHPGLDLGRTIGQVSLDRVAFGFVADFASIRNALGDLHLVQTLLLTSATLAAVSMLDFTFTVRTVQNLSDARINPRRDLAGQGLANIATAAIGGMPVTAALGATTSLFENGGRTRAAAIAMALTFLVAALVGTKLIATMPIIVLTAMMVCIAWKMWDRWCGSVVRDALGAKASGSRTRARRNLAVVAAVMAATVLGQPVLGALVGGILSCIVFILEMSRPIVRRQVNCTHLASKRIRSQHDRAILAMHGERIVVFDLQGVLFFGNADDLGAAIQDLPPTASTVVLDLRRVGDLDTSAATVLHHIARRCREQGLRLVLAHPHETYDDLLRTSLADEPDVRYFPDLDAALEDAEERILARHRSGGDGRRLEIHETDFAGGLAEADLEALTAKLELQRFAGGEPLCRAGEPADRLWLLARGSVSIRVAGAHRDRRIAGLGPGTTVGEMGLLDRRPRSADVVADEAVEAYMLTAEDFDALLREEKRLGQSLLATIARLTAQRLRDTSEELRLAEG